MPKRLIQINVTAQGGSTGAIAEHLSRAAALQGWEAWTFFGRGTIAPNSQCYRIGCRLDQLCHSACARLADHHGEFSRLATRAAIRKMQEIQPNLVHLHVLHGYYINYPILFEYLSKAGIPVIWTLHDCWPFTGRCVHPEIQHCDRWKTGCGNCPSKGSYPMSIFDGTHSSWISKRKSFGKLPRLTLVPVSRWMESIARESFLKDNAIRTIPNGVDTLLFHPVGNAKASLGIQGKLLLGVSMFWNRQKGLQDFIQLDAHLPEDCRIALIGLDKPIPGTRIIPVPRTTDMETLAAWYGAADITLNLSYAESFGMTTIESLACGTQVIAYDRTASPELMADTAGAVVPAGDIASLASAVLRLLEHPCPADVCRRHVLENFSMERQLASYLHLYEELTP